MLPNKVGLITGVANAHSIAAGCAVAIAKAGGDVMLTCLNEKAAPYAQPVADAANAKALLPMNVGREEEVEAVFEKVRAEWGRLDFLLHCIAFCPKDDLHAQVIDCSREGFAEAMDVSCHSFIRLARHALPLMSDGGSLLTVSYHGAEKVVDHYNIMGPVKAALEAVVRYLAADLGPKGVRVNALSPGPIATRAASGIEAFDALMHEAAERAPAGRLSTIEDAGAMAAFLVSDGAKAITGGVHYVDCGVNVMS
ncbi:MAG: enoyl-ACP reductase FabI [Pseudomonadota bacterium]